MPKGYDVGNGWRGRLPSGEWQIFPTEAEYLTAYREQLNAETQTTPPAKSCTFGGLF